MMRRIKWAISLILATVMAVSVGILAACSPENGSGKVNVTGVTLDKTEASVEVGKTLQLTATVAPEDATNKKVVWSVDDDDYATVDQNGLVTGVATGFATVTAKTEDGEFTASCDIEVIPAKGDKLFEKTAASGEKTSKLTIYSGNSYDLSGAATVYDAASGAAVMTLDIADVAGAQYEVAENRMVFPGTETISVTFSGTEMKFPLLSRQENADGNFKLTLYVNNGAADFIIGEFTFAAAEATQLGIDVSAITTTPVDSVTLTQNAITIVSGQNQDISSLVSVLPEEAAETATVTYSVKTQNTDETVVLAGSTVYAIKSGEATITVSAGGKSADLTVTVNYPANPYTAQEKFDKERTFTGTYELKMGDLVLGTFNSSFTFGTDGMVYERLNSQTDGSRFGSSMGYYNLTKESEAITAVEVRLFENAEAGKDLPKVTFSYTEADGEGTLTETTTEGTTWGTLTESVAKPFASQRTFRAYMTYEGIGEMSQTFVFKADGTYTFKWILGVEIVSDEGTYSVVNNVITTTVTSSTVAQGQDAYKNASQGSFTITTDATTHLDQIQMGTTALVEYLGEAYEADTTYSCTSVLDLSSLNMGTITTVYTFTFKADGTYTAVLTTNGETTVTDTGIYGVANGTLTCKALESTTATGSESLAKSSNGTFTITENEGKNQFTVGVYTLIEQTAE